MQRILAEGEDAVTKIREYHGKGDLSAAEDYGKKAAGCWAQAQVHATLALVEQKRIANTIALMQLERESDTMPTDALDAVYEREHISALSNQFRLHTRTEIKEALGL